MDRQAAWNIFLSSGRIEDYLQYKKVQNAAGVQDQGEDAVPDAHSDRWDSDVYRQYR